jgi:hypothetical protein
VDLSDAAIASLKAHRAKLAAEFLKKGESLPEWVFPNRDGKPHSMTNVRNRISIGHWKRQDCIGVHCMRRVTLSPPY